MDPINIQAYTADMGQERRQQRQYFLDAWTKRETPDSLSALEKQLLEVIKLHPEYQNILDDPDILDKDYRTDNNPFLHMSLHLGLLEQLSTNRPAGIREHYQRLYQHHQDEHQVQHLMMDVMATIMWDAQQNGKLPNEQLYLKKLKSLT